MPAKSQQRFMGMVLQCQKTGECSSKSVKDAAGSMSSKEANKFAKTKQKGLPERISERKQTFREFLLIEPDDKGRFEKFMKRVDRILTNRFGYMDFPDYIWMMDF